MVSPDERKDIEEREEESPLVSRAREIDKLPRRSPLLHWAGIILALVAFVMLLIWMAQPQDVLPRGWLWVDVAIGVLSALEFFTRSGFRWKPGSYVRGHIFEFIAIVPSLALIQYSVPYEQLWLWIILIARGARLINRLLGDGFVQRNTLALAGAAEEEITDRVLLRLMAKIEVDMGRGKFGSALAGSFPATRNKSLPVSARNARRTGWRWRWRG